MSQPVLHGLRRRVGAFVLRTLFLSLSLFLSLTLTPTPADAQTPPVFRNPLAELTVPAERPGPAFHPIETEYFRMTGYLRLRGSVQNDLDLERGALASGGSVWPRVGTADDTVTSANMRLRLEPELRWGGLVRIAARIDVLDNLVLGSTPRGYPSGTSVPTVSASASQDVPVAGVNSVSDALRVKQVWGELYLPFGVLMAGRMGNQWGLGMVASSGSGMDDDVDDSVDRIGFVTSLWDHVIAASFDFNAKGPSTATMANPLGQAQDLSTKDDVWTVSLAVQRWLPPDVIRAKTRAGRVVVNYGLYGTWRRQAEETPYYHLLAFQDASSYAWGPDDRVRTATDLWGGDAWFRLNAKGVRFELEAAYFGGQAASTIATMNESIQPPGTGPGNEPADLAFAQWGLVAQLEWQPWERIGLTFLGETGVASGDRAWGFGAYPDRLRPQAGDLDGAQFAWDDWSSDHRIDNFRFHPNYHVDRILWRRIVGTFTDGVYAKLRARWLPIESVRIDLAGIYSRALYAESAPGLAKPLGFEADLDATWFGPFGVEASAAYAVLFPLAGFRNIYTGADPSPAHFAEVRLAFRF